MKDLEPRPAIRGEVTCEDLQRVEKNLSLKTFTSGRKYRKICAISVSRFLGHLAELLLFMF